MRFLSFNTIGKISELKRFKDDVKEVQSGQECGLAFDNNEDTTFQIIGLTLYNGKTTSRGGGSIKIENGGVKIKNVIFKENYSTGEDWSTSGAIWMERSGKTIIDGCTFDGNYIYNTEAGNIGGAIFASHQNNKSDFY